MTKRSTLNSGFMADFTYALIDHFLQGDQFGMYGHQWETGTVFNRAILDEYGCQSVITADPEARQWATGIRIPALYDFEGPYVLDNIGNNLVYVDWGEYTVVGGYNWEHAAEDGQHRTFKAIDPTQPSRVELVYTGFPGERVLFSVRCQLLTTAPEVIPGRPRWYRLEDEEDLNAGKVFRRGWKQTIVDHNPGIYRVMDWSGGNSSMECRWEDRKLPSYRGYQSNNFNASPPYGETSGVNRMTLDAVDGTPATMKHGMIATARIGAGCGIARSGLKPVTGISKSANPTVACAAHGFVNDEKIIHYITEGMVELDWKICTVTVVDEDHYTIDVDTTGFSDFTIGHAVVYCSLTITNGEEDLGEYPVLFVNGSAIATVYNDGYIQEKEYKTFWFDKNLELVPGVQGAWLFSNLGHSPHWSIVPPEIIAALANELNEMGPQDPIDIWVCIPHRGLLSIDPDYAPESNFAVGYVGVLLNGANGYEKVRDGIRIWIEFANETWNSAGDAFSQTPFLARIGYQRNPSVGRFDWNYYSTLRMAIMIEDLRAAYGDNPQMKFVMCGQGSIGSYGNRDRLFGSAALRADPLWPWGDDDPVDHVGMWAYASYLVVDDEIAELATKVEQWSAATTDEERNDVIQAYVNAIVNTGSGETIKRYIQVLDDYCTALADKAAIVGQYEGEWDHSISYKLQTWGHVEEGSNVVTNANSGLNTLVEEGDYVVAKGLPPLTKITGFSGDTFIISDSSDSTVAQADIWIFNATNMFLYSVKRSQAWGVAVTRYFDAFDFQPKANYPAAYVASGLRWGDAWPDFYENGREGGRFSRSYDLKSDRNYRKNIFRISTN